MLRIPNPNSDIDQFIRVYCATYNDHQSKKIVSLFDIRRTLIDHNLATSSGYMGEEALRRSTNADLSRDRLYNQAKSYSEIFRALGWLYSPSPENALQFRLTHLGSHVVRATEFGNSKGIFIQSLLGWVYPNPVLDVESTHILRPFATILKALLPLDGYISRDEMIIGPLSIEDDRDSRLFDEMVDKIHSIRKIGQSALLESLEVVAQSGRKNPVQVNTLRNYTRFLIAALQWAGWVYKKKNVFALTEQGNQLAKQISTAADLRGVDLENLDENVKEAISRFSFYKILERSGFDLTPVLAQYVADRETSIKWNQRIDSSILFSPFQELSFDFLDRLFPSDLVSHDAQDSLSKPTVFLPNNERVSIFGKVTLSFSKQAETARTDDYISSLLQGYTASLDALQIANEIASKFSNANKEEFYPLVARLFEVLGYRCTRTQFGRNPERWDAMIVDEIHSVPIEIKSPGEELFISVKAVRQALENKIILLSRKSYPTSLETTSLAVGYNPPNDRAEVSSLISNIYDAYGISIGVIDFRSLLLMVVEKVLFGKTHNLTELLNLRGIIDVSNS